jgi:nucleoside phosphorylase
VLVLAAMDRELRPLVRALSLQRGFVGELPVWLGPPGGVSAAVVGIGPTMAGSTTRDLLAAAGPYVGERVLIIGVCGAIDPSLAVGDLVVPDVVVDRATGARYRPAPLVGLPGRGGLVRSPSGVLVTSPSLAVGPTAVAELRAVGATAVDMETAAVAAACDERAVPWSVLRAVSDVVADGLVDPAILGLTRPDGRTDPAGVARYILRRPWAVHRLARLGRNAAHAVRTVTRAAVVAVAAEP